MMRIRHPGQGPNVGNLVIVALGGRHEGPLYVEDHGEHPNVANVTTIELDCRDGYGR